MLVFASSFSSVLFFSCSASQVEVHTLTLPHGRGQLTLILRDLCPYFLNGDLQMILPQAHQNVMTTIRSLLDIPLEYATRYSFTSCTLWQAWASPMLVKLLSPHVYVCVCIVRHSVNASVF